MSKFMNEINKIINKEGDGVKTIIEAVAPATTSPRPRGTVTTSPRPRGTVTTSPRPTGTVLSGNTPGSRPEPRPLTIPAPAATTRGVGSGDASQTTTAPASTAPASTAPASTPSPIPTITPSGPVSQRGDVSQRPAPVSTRPTAPIPPRRPDNLGSPSNPAERPIPTPPPRPTTPAAAPVDPNAKSKEMFQSYSNKGDDASSSDFVRADNQRTAELKGMRNETFERFVRSFVKEENASKEQWKGEIKKKPYMGANPEHAPTSPNAQHMEEDEQLDEISGTATSFGGRHNPRRSTAKYLAGKRFKTRVSLQASGNQRRRPGVYEEVKGKFMKKLSEKRSETPLGKTATNSKYSETVNTSPESPELTTST